MQLVPLHCGRWTSGCWRAAAAAHTPPGGRARGGENTMKDVNERTRVMRRDGDLTNYKYDDDEY
jgi:hypothetical protein